MALLNPNVWSILYGLRWEPPYFPVGEPDPSQPHVRAKEESSLNQSIFLLFQLEWWSSTQTLNNVDSAMMVQYRQEFNKQFIFSWKVAQNHQLLNNSSANYSRHCLPLVVEGI